MAQYRESTQTLLRPADAFHVKKYGLGRIYGRKYGSVRVPAAVRRNALLAKRSEPMARTLLPPTLLLILVAMTGCRMGISQFDYCGPVWDNGRCASCNTDYRAGSILNKGEGPAAGVRSAPPNVPSPMGDRAASQQRAGKAAGTAAQRARQNAMAANQPTQQKKRQTAANSPSRNVQRVTAEQPARQYQRTAQRAAGEQLARQPQRTAQRRPTPTEQWENAPDPMPSQTRQPQRMPAGQTGRAPVGQTEPAPAGTAEGATRILSVSDRKLDELAEIDGASTPESPAPPVRRTVRSPYEMR